MASIIKVDTIQNATGAFEHARLVQVQSVTKTTAFTTTSTSLVDITGFTDAITPTNSANKILVIVSANIANSTADNASMITLIRGTTAIAIGTDGSGFNVSGYTAPSENYDVSGVSIVHVDSPSSTSAVTYKVQAQANNGTFCLNRRGDDTSTAMVSSITLVEIRT